MKTFYVRGKVVEWYDGMLIDALSEDDAKLMYENLMLESDVLKSDIDVSVWNEMEEEQA